jgi:hypothetical protein
VPPEVKTHTPPITKGNSPGEGEKKKESDFCLMEREKKKNNCQNSIQKDRSGELLFFGMEPSKIILENKVFVLKTVLYIQYIFKRLFVLRLISEIP